MKRILLLLLLQVSAIVCFADEYKDPATNVIYTYDPAGDRAEVKQGALYDLSGRKISAEANSSFFTLHSSLKRGIYIEGGKKKVK